MTSKYINIPKQIKKIPTITSIFVSIFLAINFPKIIEIKLKIKLIIPKIIAGTKILLISVHKEMPTNKLSILTPIASKMMLVMPNNLLCFVSFSKKQMIPKMINIKELINLPILSRSSINGLKKVKETKGNIKWNAPINKGA